jgi:hypothetical protein
MMSMYRQRTSGQQSTGLMLWIRRLVLLAFALIQLVLVARILLDLGVIPTSDAGISGLIITWSDILAAPVEGLGDGLSTLFGGAGFDTIAGDGLNALMVGALVGWTVVEGLVMRVVAKFEAI